MKNRQTPPEKNKHLSHQMMIVTHRHDHRIRQRMEELGITRATGPLLFEISRSEGISQQELASRMHFKASSISVSIQKMCENDLIRQEENAVDARKDALYLTEKGRSCQQKIHATFDELEEEFLAPLKEEERQQLCLLLEKLLQENK